LENLLKEVKAILDPEITHENLSKMTKASVLGEMKTINE
jgi:hypothetical protein